MRSGEQKHKLRDVAAITVVAFALAWPMAGRAETGATGDRLHAREETLASNIDAAVRAARREAQLAYRLARRRQLGFLANPSHRAGDVQAANLALAVLERRMTEIHANKDELVRARAESTFADDEADAAADAGKNLRGIMMPRPAFRAPVAGPIVGRPGLHRDSVTGREVRDVGVQILARMNDSVRTAAPGTVRHVGWLPQGGFSVVTEHAGHFISIVSGLRAVTVIPGQAVERGQLVGLAGRNLDGAPVVSFEAWRNRMPENPLPFR